MWVDKGSEKVSVHRFPDTETEGRQRESPAPGPPDWSARWAVRQLVFLRVQASRAASYPIPAGGSSLTSTTRNICRCLTSSNAPQGSVLRFRIWMALILLRIVCQISPKKINLIVDVFESVPLAWIL